MSSARSQSAGKLRVAIAHGTILALVLAVCLGTLPLGTTAWTSPASARPATDTTVDTSTIPNEWIGLDERTDRNAGLDLEIQQFSPAVLVLADDGQARLRVNVRLHNRSEEKIDRITLRLQRGEPLPDAAGAGVAMAMPEGVFSMATEFSEPIGIAAGQSASYTFDVDASAASPAGLGITAAGTYPILVNANGRPGGAGADIVQLLAETRTLLPVVEDGDATSSETATTPVSLFWPIAEKVSIVPGETGEAPDRAPLILSDDSLADSLRPGGHLDRMLAALETRLADPQSTQGQLIQRSVCLSIDPETVDTVARMRGGYQVGNHRPSPVEESPRLRDSWGTQLNRGLSAGSGAEAAQRWFERLQNVASEMCVVVWPRAAAELTAATATNNAPLIKAALYDGGTQVSELLGVPVDSSVQLVPEGYLTDESIPWLSQEFTVAAVEELYDDSPTAAPPAETPAAPSDPGADAAVPAGIDPAANGEVRKTVLVANNTVTTDDGQISGIGTTGDLGGTASTFSLPGATTAALTTSGTNPQLPGYSSVNSRREYELDSSLARIQAALGTLAQDSRDLIAGAAGDTAAAEATTEDDEDATFSGNTTAPLVMVPPAAWDITNDDANQLFDGLEQLTNAAMIAPLSPIEAVAISASGHHRGAVELNTPESDPAAISEQAIDEAADISRAITQLTLLMSDDPNITLTRRNFTLPLRQDLIRSFSSYNRREANTHTEANNQAHEHREKTADMVRRIRDSVALLAPGGVYTRATGLSPLVVVGRNGLPLPVPATVRIRGDNAEVPASHQEVLPARGSITITLDPETELQGADDQLEMWLESRDGQIISDSTTMIVQSGVTTRTLLWITLAVVLGIGAVVVERRRRKRLNQANSQANKPAN